MQRSSSRRRPGSEGDSEAKGDRNAGQALNPWRLRMDGPKITWIDYEKRWNRGMHRLRGQRGTLQVARSPRSGPSKNGMKGGGTIWIRSPPHRTPAHGGLWHCGKLHRGLHKAESSLAIQLRTEVGFAAFLHARRVPGVLSPACQCGWRRQDPKHIIMFCPDHAATRDRLFEEAGTRQCEVMLAAKKGSTSRGEMGVRRRPRRPANPNQVRKPNDC